MAHLAKNSSFNGASLIDAITPVDWIRGAHDGKVVLVEYSDFQCPACGRYEPLLRQLAHEFGNKLEFVYRYFPLRQIHINAELSAVAAEAAGKQGKFWEMHDAIFDRQDDWAESPGARAMFIGYAEDLKLNVEKFKADLDSREIADRIEKDFQGGERAGVDSTPTFFLNGQKIPNPRTYAEFQTLINQTVANNP
ncbi:DsbA family protein [Patescibacteria group bacterium]|nr:DsbA family protein [Patescibacteria group bacterium]